MCGDVAVMNIRGLPLLGEWVHCGDAALQKSHDIGGDPVRENFTRLVGFPPIWFAPPLSQTPSTSVCKIRPLHTCSMYDEQLQAALEDLNIASEGFKCIGRNGDTTKQERDRGQC